MKENNVTDVNVYFKDPVNSVRFISPKVLKLKHSIPFNFLFSIFHFQFKVYDERFIPDYETVFGLKTSINQKIQEVDNCENYGTRLN